MELIHLTAARKVLRSAFFFLATLINNKQQVFLLFLYVLYFYFTKSFLKYSKLSAYVAKGC